MTKPHSFALWATVTAVITFAAGSALTQDSTDADRDHKSQGMQHEKGMHLSRDARKSGATTMSEHRSNRDQSRTKNRVYMDSTPDNGLHASNLMGTGVKTADGEDVGSVNDLIIDKHGQVVAIVVGVGGILGMGEKNVAIRWDDVKHSGEYKTSAANEESDDSDDELDLRIKVSREDLRSAPEFETED